jgi:dolichol kinase
MINTDKIRLKKEGWRKIIHVFFHTATAVLLMQIDSRTFRILFFIGSLIFIACDFYRIHGGAILNRIIQKIFGKVIRDWEYKRLSAASFSLISLSFLMLYLPKEIIALASLYLGFADPIATFGRSISKKLEFPGIKSLEGGFAFILSCLVITYIFSLIWPQPFEDHNFWLIGLSGAIAGAAAETLSVKHFDDNLTIPLASALGLWLLWR